MTILQDAVSELGTVEGKGTLNNPRVIEYHKAAGGFSEDSVPWCGSFIAWLLQKNKLPYDRRLASGARYWVTDYIKQGYGKLLKTPIPGAIIVIPRGTGSSGHVFLFVRWLDKKMGLFEGIGGNQGGGARSGNDGAVTIAKYQISSAIGIAWPVAVPIPQANKSPIKSEAVVGGSTVLGAGVLTAGQVGPSLGKAIDVLTQPKQETIAEIVQDSGGSLVEAVHKSEEARAGGTLFGAAVALVIIVAAVWIIVARINSLRKQADES